MTFSQNRPNLVGFGLDLLSPLRRTTPSSSSPSNCSIFLLSGELLHVSPLRRTAPFVSSPTAPSSSSPAELFGKGENKELGPEAAGAASPSVYPFTLVKRVFLSSERKLSRKFIEGLLSLMVEKRISKWIILYSYLKKMYWGRGVFGIESASQFYFGKSPSFLSVGESAMLAGILPGPEFLNPLTNPARAKSSQAKVLRRMVSAGYLEMETALQIAREPFFLYPENKMRAKGLIKF